MRLTPHSGLEKRERRRRFLEFGLPGTVGLILMAFFFFCSGDDSPFEVSGPHEFPAFRTLELKVSGKALWRLRARREKALRDEVLIQEPGDWVKGNLMEGEEEWRVKLRLKGDWTDHLQQGKWSFRVQVKDSSAFRRLKEFSLQSPRTRSFLDEWYFHQVLHQEEVLTTRYDFVRLHFNGAELGIYAIEEHFEKALIESKGHREGPLLKLSEDGLWEARRLAIEDPDFPFMDLPLYEAAQPEAFSAQDLLDNPKLSPLHKQAQTLLHAYKYGLKPASELFDLDVTARGYALIDLFRAHHSLVWHNRRFYFEPIHARLQPIVYDAFSGDVSGQYLNGPFTGYASNGRTHYNGRMDLLGTRFFAEDSFVVAYYKYLHQYTAPEFLDGLEENYSGPLEERKNFLRREYLFYEFEVSKLGSYADEIRKGLRLDTELLELEEGTCFKNYNPVPVLVEVDGVGILLDAYDGRGLAESIQLPDSVKLVECSVPGGVKEVVNLEKH